MEDPRGVKITPPANPARRGFFKGLGKAGLSATAAMLFGDSPLLQGQSTAANQDTALEILNAALIAEDLATVFYYNGLVGQVIQDPSLAGPGGTATSVTINGDAPNVAYLRAALGQEIQHAATLRAVGNFGNSPSTDPFQTFYFDPATFTNISNFLSTLDALENAFIGAYLNAIRELGVLAFRAGQRGVPNGPYGGPFSAFQLQSFALVAGSILGVECEHRVLGRVIAAQENQVNNLNYEQTDGLTSVYHGQKSAVAALQPFLNSGNGLTAYSLSAAVTGSGSVLLTSTGTVPL